MIRQALLASSVIAGMTHACLAATSSEENVTAGARFAQAQCSQCHVVVRSDSSGWTDAPFFPSIADRPTTTEQSLRAFLSTPQIKMLHQPKTEADMSAVIAYILSLRKP